MSFPEKPRSNLWFLLPILFGIIGGAVAYLFLRRDDLNKARKCLFLGLVFMIIGIIFNIIVGSSIPSIDSGFNVNI
ncbi:MAG: hypothetical protein ACRBB5_03745 [Nitrosopumilus sp.]